MEINEYSIVMKKIYDLILEFIESVDDDDENFANLIYYIQNQQIFENPDKIHEIMIIINKISKNHSRQNNLIQKTEKILNHYKDQIKQTFSNFQIFNFFKHNKKVLLFLIQQQIVTIDDEILHKFILNEKYIDYKFYFFNEIKDKISNEMKKSIEEEMDTNKNPQIDDDKLSIGENDNYICSLIRKDSINDFISNLTRMNISPNGQIPHSIYETNHFLMQNKNTSLIEYASFFGSMQIIRYLAMNGAELTKSMWIYGIHSNNPELINFLEENNVVPEDEKYDKCYKEAIKCHHNNVADYILNNLLIEQNDQEEEEVFCYDHYHHYYRRNGTIRLEYSEEKNINDVKTSFRYHNYYMMQTFFDNVNNVSLFFYFVQYNYIDFVKFYVRMNKIDINEKNNKIHI